MVCLVRRAAHPAGRELQRQIKAWRGKFFVFLQDRRVPPTNNVSKREIRPSVVFRKVINGFRSTWGATVHAGYRSITGTARLCREPPPPKPCAHSSTGQPRSRERHWPAT